MTSEDVEINMDNELESIINNRENKGKVIVLNNKERKE